MQAFEYASPTNREQAAELLGKAGAVILAGGTDLVSLMKDGVIAPSRLVNIKRIADLGGIQTAGAGLRIGATVTLDELLRSESVRKEYPSLMQAAKGILSPQIRNIGTVGGELCQRPRCWYFRKGFGLLALQEGRSVVPQGDNRYHAILGNEGPAYFVHPSSLAPPLLALGAQLRVFGAEGERDVSLSEFFRTPQAEGEMEHTLAADELVTEIRIPAAAGVLNATYEVRHREALDWPLAAAAVALRMSGDTVGEARVVLGHVAPTPWSSTQAGRALIGKKITEESAAEAAAAAVTGAKALSQNGYKVHLARTAVKRAILRAAGTEV